jgi:hypothetical protein
MTKCNVRWLADDGYKMSEFRNIRRAKNTAVYLVRRGFRHVSVVQLFFKCERLVRAENVQF